MEAHGTVRAVAALEAGIGKAYSGLVAEGVTPAASANGAAQAALAALRAGQRASALIAGEDLIEVLPVVAEARRDQLPLVIHAFYDGELHGRGRDEVAPLLQIGGAVVSAWTTQESVDVAIAARRAALDSELPVTVVHEVRSHAQEAHLLDVDAVASFLGPARAPSHGGDALQRRRGERSLAVRLPFALAAAFRELGDLTKRHHHVIERFDATDAEELIVTAIGGYPQAREVASALRREGRRVGAVGVRALRPLYIADLVKACSRASAIVVIEPLDIALAPSGPIAAELKAGFLDALTWAPGFPGVGRVPPIVSTTFATLARGVRDEDIRAALTELHAGDRARRTVVLGT
jgi:pyruvate-ferredoxin/flavodoxin oxidoreductase